MRGLAIAKPPRVILLSVERACSMRVIVSHLVTSGSLRYSIELLPWYTRAREPLAGVKTAEQDGPRGGLGRCSRLSMMLQII